MVDANLAKASAYDTTMSQRRAPAIAASCGSCESQRRWRSSTPVEKVNGADRQALPVRPPRRVRPGHAPPRDHRPVAQAGRASPSARSPTSEEAGGPPDPRPVRRGPRPPGPRLRRPPRLDQDLRRLRAHHRKSSHVEQVAMPQPRGRSRPSCPTWPAARSPPSPTRRPAPPSRSTAGSTRSSSPWTTRDLLLQPGQRGFAKIDGGHCTLGWWLWRLISKTFHFTI